MMSWLRGFARFLLLTALLAVSVVGVLSEFPRFGGLFDQVRATGVAIIKVWTVPNYGLFFLWLGLMLLSVLHLLLALTGRRKRVHVEVETGDGRVCILESAIRKYIQTVLARIPGVVSKRVDLRSERRGLKVDIYAFVRTQDGLANIKEQMIDKVKSALTEQMGIPAIAGVDVFIEDFEVRQKGTGREVPVEPALDTPQKSSPSPSLAEPPRAYPPDEALAASPYLAGGRGAGAPGTAAGSGLRSEPADLLSLGAELDESAESDTSASKATDTGSQAG